MLLWEEARTIGRSGTVHGFVGPNVLFAGADLERLQADLKLSCERLSQSDCEARFDPYLGFSLGGGAGLLVELSEAVGLRVDLIVQRVSFAGPKIRIVDSAASSGSVGLSWSGWRYWLAAGLDI